VAISELPSGGKIKRGGRLTVASIGGGNTETLNPMLAGINPIDIGRQACLYDWLVGTPDLQGNVPLRLAESMEPNKDGTVWTIRLRPGVEFHDGSPLTADDVLYSLNYIADPENAALNGFMATFFNLKEAKKLDNLTVRLPLSFAIGDLGAMIGAGTGLAIIKDGTTNFEKPNGTGPWKFQSWTQGQHSLFVRNPNYWESGVPYLDELYMVSISEETARLNAVLSGQVDAAAQMPYAQGQAYASGSGPVNVLVNNGIPEVYFTMGTASKPFNDVRVRQAFRLIVDRKALIDEVQSGYGTVLNDLWGKGFPYYNSSLPQREQDIEQAKSLLKQAGYDNNLSVTLTTAEASAGQLPAATLYAQQAAEAGVKVTLKKLPEASYYSTGWPNYSFGQTSYQGTPIPYFYAAAMLPEAPYNDTQWTEPKAINLLKAAIGDANKATAKDKWDEFQKFMWENGAQIHWGTAPYIDLVAKHVNAAPPTSAFYDFGGYNFNRYWLS
jgi:peptide/nickel transport system substrate-binding protein